MTFAELRDFIKAYYMTWATKRALNELIDLVEAGGGGGGAVDSVNGQTGVVVLNKNDIGLSNVDNTTDLNKPISTATQNGLDLKANIASPTFTGTVSGITKSMVGLGSVDNTSDLSKPISTATQTALNAKENTITAGTTSQYYRGDKSFQTLNSASVGLGNVDNTSDLNKPISTATQTALNTIISDLYENPFFLATPAGQTVSIQYLGGTLTATGTATAAALANTNRHTQAVRLEYAVTAAATTAVAGARQGVNIYYLHDGSSSADVGFDFMGFFGPSRGLASNATKRLLFGIGSGANTAPTDISINTVSGHTVDGIFFGYDNTESNLCLKVANNSTLVLNTDLGASFPKAGADNTDWYKVIIRSLALNSTYVEITNLTTSATFSTTITNSATLPRTTNRMGFKCWQSVGGTSSVIGISIGRIYVKGGAK